PGGRSPPTSPLAWGWSPPWPRRPRSSSGAGPRAGPAARRPGPPRDSRPAARPTGTPATDCSGRYAAPPAPAVRAAPSRDVSPRPGPVGSGPGERSAGGGCFDRLTVDVELGALDRQGRPHEQGVRARLHLVLEQVAVRLVDVFPPGLVAVEALGHAPAGVSGPGRLGTRHSATRLR